MILKLPYPPSVNGLFAGTGRRYKSKAYRAWITAAGWSAKSQAGAERIRGPWSIELRAVRPDRRQRDIDNLIKPTVDLMVSLGLVSDDSEMQTVFAAWVPGNPEKPPVISVSIFQHNEGKG